MTLKGGTLFGLPQVILCLIAKSAFVNIILNILEKTCLKASIENGNKSSADMQRNAGQLFHILWQNRYIIIVRHIFSDSRLIIGWKRIKKKRSGLMIKDTIENKPAKVDKNQQAHTGYAIELKRKNLEKGKKFYRKRAKKKSHL